MVNIASWSCCKADILTGVRHCVKIETDLQSGINFANFLLCTLMRQSFVAIHFEGLSDTVILCVMAGLD